MADYDYIPKLYNVRFENPGSARQSDEHFLADVDGETRRFNIHDYASLYRVPWLYDIALYHFLECRTPTEMVPPIGVVWDEAEVDPSRLRVLELGAGSGAFGHELKYNLGVGRIEGLDIAPEAAEAAARDRAALYDAYHVVDLTALTSDQEATLRAAAFDVVAMASATGWGNHIPVAGFETGFDLLTPGGWFIFHVKPNDPDPECVALCAWVDEKIASGALSQRYRKAHFHRRSSGGGDIFYDVVVGVKA